MSAKVLRYGLIGPESSGKSSLSYLISTGFFLESYYPTLHQNTTLVKYEPANLISDLPPAYSNESTVDCPPVSTDALFEFIDFPGFNPHEKVELPFVTTAQDVTYESSNPDNQDDRQCTKILYQPLIVASHSSNSDVEGYLLVASVDDTERIDTIFKMRSWIRDAWKTYYAYKSEAFFEHEDDIYSLRGLWKSSMREQQRSMEEQKAMKNAGIEKLMRKLEHLKEGGSQAFKQLPNKKLQIKEIMDIIDYQEQLDSQLRNLYDSYLLGGQEVGELLASPEIASLKKDLELTSLVLPKVILVNNKIDKLPSLDAQTRSLVSHIDVLAGLWGMKQFSISCATKQGVLEMTQELIRDSAHKSSSLDVSKVVSLVKGRRSQESKSATPKGIRRLLRI